MFPESSHSAVMIIAEIGVNHNGEEHLALDLIKAARKTGADVVKFQTFRADQFVTTGAATTDYQARQIGEKNQLEMLRGLELSFAAFRRLKKFSEEHGLVFLSSPFDEESVEQLDHLGVRAFKVGSGEITNFPLLEKIVHTRKPLLLSTGMADLDEIRAAVDFLQKKKCEDLILFHCVSDYPAQIADLNLMFMNTLKNEFHLPVGLSDHSLSLFVPAAAVALGARFIEKHFTLDRNLPGPDHQASLGPADFTRMVEAVREVEQALGSMNKILTPTELKTRNLVRKSIVARQDLKKGIKLEQSHLAFKRPGTGLAPSRIAEVVGKILLRDIKMDELIDLTKVG